MIPVERRHGSGVLIPAQLPRSSERHGRRPLAWL